LKALGITPKIPNELENASVIEAAERETLECYPASEEIGLLRANFHAVRGQAGTS
jgi:hypothetical protein